MKSNKSHGGLSAVQNMIVTTLIILFFLGIIAIYYSMLRYETRENIIANGKMHAISSSDQIDKYLSSGIDVLKLTAYAIDNMIRDNRPSEDILDYLTNQSVATTSIVEGQATGIYAYINGEYLDGVGWEPDDDYIPTERPWYISAMAMSGGIAVVDPYVDAQTQAVTITLAKTLCDAKSVVAMDISLEKLQTITEELAANGESDMEIVLDRTYQVISCSDKKEVGKRYHSNDGSFGSVIIDQLRKQDAKEGFFYLDYDNTTYIVYDISIENDWVCITVMNASAEFNRLSSPLILTIVASVLIIAVLLIIMARSYKRYTLAEQMKNIADQQKEYAYHDTLTGLKNRRAYAEKISQLSHDLPKDCCVIIFDVNGLKNINDSHGHGAGDELLIAASKCICSAFEGVDNIYRIGGDEFCLICDYDEEKASECLARLEKIMSEYVWHGNKGLSISYGCGTVKEYEDIYEILKDADRNMYEHKTKFYRSVDSRRYYGDAE